MPVARVSSRPIDVNRYDVVGIDSKTNADFVTHVALAREGSNELSHDSSLEVVHMVPPYQCEDIARIRLIGTVPLGLVNVPTELPMMREY